MWGREISGSGSAAAAIAGAGIQPATMAALDEAATVLAAHPDRFAEVIIRQLRAQLFAILGQFDAAETEVGLCWAAGRGGAVHVVENAAPQAEARLAAARGDTATAVGALRRAADGGRRFGSIMFVPAALAAVACMAARAAAQARHALGDDGFAQAWEQGQALALDDAVAFAARKGGGRKRPATGWASLTPAELEVARLVGAGLRNDAIAQRLFIATGTVKVHLTHIFTKLGITTRTELAAQAAAQDLTARRSDR